jgi:hypothetical protein
LRVMEEMVVVIPLVLNLNAGVVANQVWQED